MDNLYYVAPSDDIFNEVKTQALKIWDTYSDEYGYRTEKRHRIENLDNVGDNVMYIVAMFDTYNQRTLAQNLLPKSRQAIKERLIAGGAIPDYIEF